MLGRYPVRDTCADAVCLVPASAWHRMRTGTATKGAKDYDRAMITVQGDDTPPGGQDWPTGNTVSVALVSAGTTVTVDGLRYTFVRERPFTDLSVSGEPGSSARSGPVLGRADQAPD